MRTDYEETQNLKKYSVKDCPYHANKDKILKGLMNFLFCVFLFLMMLLWLLSRKKTFGRRSGYFCLGNLFFLEVPVMCLCLILRLRFFVLKIVF